MTSAFDRLASIVRQLQGAWRRGEGDPDGVVAAPVGTAYLRTDGGTSTTLYVKETGGETSSGWVAK